MIVSNFLDLILFILILIIVQQIIIALFNKRLNELNKKRLNFIKHEFTKIF
jgi:hypothetical protein